VFHWELSILLWSRIAFKNTQIICIMKLHPISVVLIDWNYVWMLNTQYCYDFPQIILPSDDNWNWTNERKKKTLTDPDIYSMDNIFIPRHEYPQKFRDEHFDVLLIYTVDDCELAEGFRYVLETCITLEVRSLFYLSLSP
jgi:hypothetical protein